MKNGQALVEYLLIVLVISVIAVAAVSFFGGYLTDAITKTSCSLVDEVFEPGRRRGEGKCVPVEEEIKEKDVDSESEI